MYNPEEEIYCKIVRAPPDITQKLLLNIKLNWDVLFWNYNKSTPALVLPRAVVLDEAQSPVNSDASLLEMLHERSIYARPEGSTAD